jgi:hypothetical protein
MGVFRNENAAALPFRATQQQEKCSIPAFSATFAIRSVGKQVLHFVQDDNIYDKNF